LKYWLDDKLIIDHTNVLMRTAQHADMKFNQFIIAPWIGDGSPIDQHSGWMILLSRTCVMMQNKFNPHKPTSFQTSCLL